MGVYEVERVIAKRIKRAEAEYFIHWKNYSPSENTWESAEHLPEDIIAAFENWARLFEKWITLSSG